MTDSKKGLTFDKKSLNIEVADRAQRLMGNVNVREFIGNPNTKESYLTELARAFKQNDFEAACEASKAMLKAKF